MKTVRQKIDKQGSVNLRCVKGLGLQHECVQVLLRFEERPGAAVTLLKAFEKGVIVPRHSSAPFETERMKPMFPCLSKGTRSLRLLSLRKQAQHRCDAH